MIPHVIIPVSSNVKIQTYYAKCEKCSNEFYPHNRWVRSITAMSHMLRKHMWRVEGSRTYCHNCKNKLSPLEELALRYKEATS